MPVQNITINPPPGTTVTVTTDAQGNIVITTVVTPPATPVQVYPVTPGNPYFPHMAWPPTVPPTPALPSIPTPVATRPAGVSGPVRLPGIWDVPISIFPEPLSLDFYYREQILKMMNNPTQAR